VNGVPVISPILRLALGSILFLVFIGLSVAVLDLPESSEGLKPAVMQHMPDSGVDHPVTAVLLNFRGYDTLLEVGVLLLALMAVWSTASAPRQNVYPPGLMLQRLPGLLLPVMVLVAGYLLWRGAYGPGGAFQAGAILAAAGVLLILSGTNISERLGSNTIRLLLVLGVAVFAVVGAAVMLYSGHLLAYPPEWAGVLILFIEAAATVSIAVTLTGLFIGGEPEQYQ
jgi:multisubunit Na+/H+ antiporter MnhB subunit